MGHPVEPLKQIVSPSTKFDVVVVGAGVFGSWTANFLQRAGRKVLLLDAYAPGNSRASSGGESRIIRMGYGADEIYTRWSMRSLPLWEELQERIGATIFHRTGVLWLAPGGNQYLAQTLTTFEKIGVTFERLSAADIARKYPQIAVDSDVFGILEPKSGTLMARRAVEHVVADAVKRGAEYRAELVETPAGRGRLASIRTRNGENFSAETYVFACGPWLPKVFPAQLGDLIFPTRQEVFFFGPPPGDLRFSPPALPTFIDHISEFYGMPDLEGRGIKVACDDHGPRVDPDTQERLATPEKLNQARAYLGERFPALKNAPLVESRVCQYENTSSGDFLIDRHPDFENVWIAGGGSGHGFKHGPALGEYVAERITKAGSIEPRFSLATKKTVQSRAIY
jgi:sarcosine oxidase